MQKPLPSDLIPEPDVHLPTDDFWEENKVKIIGGIVAILLIAFATIAWSAFSEARADRIMSEFAAASTPEAWREIIRKYPSEPVAGNSALLLAAFLRESGQRTASISEYEALLASRSNYSLRPAASLAISEMLASSPESNADEIASRFRQTALEFPNSYVAAYAMFAAGDALSRANKTDEAITTFRAITTEYPSSPLATMASMQVQRLSPAQEPAAPAPTEAPASTGEDSSTSLP